MSGDLNIVILNTGVSNVRSVANMLRRLQVRVTISDLKADILEADALILPGVGAFDACVERLEKANLIVVLNRKALEEAVPILGLCLGMQILGTRSQEGERLGFGWIPGELRRMRSDNTGPVKVRVPHMGWNIIRKTEGCLLYQNMGPEPRFYFDHSYYFDTHVADHIHGTARHGIEFAAGINRGNIFGVQFHPEKSHRFGLALFENFVAYARSTVDQVSVRSGRQVG